MKITCVSSYNYPKVNISHKVNFKGHPNWFEDDELSYWGDDVRHSMRNKIYGDVFGTNIKKETTNETKLAEKLDDVYILNFHNIGNSSYSGESLVHNPEYFDLLKKSGVKRVIDLVDKPELRDLCEKYNIDYYFYDMNLDYGKLPIFSNMSNSECTNLVKKENTQFIKGLKKLIDVVNQGNFYMSCEYGYRTMNCLSLVTLFNPNWNGAKIDPTKEFTQRIGNMFKNLTDEHKQILGLNEEYCAFLKKYISKFAQIA